MNSALDTIRWGDKDVSSFVVAPGPLVEHQGKQVVNVANGEPEVFQLFLGMFVNQNPSAPVSVFSRFRITIGVGSTQFSFDYTLGYDSAITVITEDQFSLSVPIGFLTSGPGGTCEPIFKSLPFIPSRDIFITPYVTAAQTGNWSIESTALAAPQYRPGDLPKRIAEWMGSFQETPLAYQRG